LVSGKTDFEQLIASVYSEPLVSQKLVTIINAKKQFLQQLAMSILSDIKNIFSGESKDTRGLEFDVEKTDSTLHSQIRKTLRLLQKK